MNEFLKMLLFIVAIPFLACIVITLICALVVVSPLIFIGYMVNNRKRLSRRRSDKHPLMRIYNEVNKSSH